AYLCVRTGLLLGPLVFPYTTLFRSAHTSVAPVASAQAVSEKSPAVRSACTTVCVPVQEIVPPGWIVLPLAGVHENPSSGGVSLTVIACGTLPVFFAVIVYGIT